MAESQDQFVDHSAQSKSRKASVFAFGSFYEKVLGAPTSAEGVGGGFNNEPQKDKYADIKVNIFLPKAMIDGNFN